MEQFNDKKSFSLIEVAVALALLALISGGMLAVFNQGFATARKTQQRTIAYSLARQIIERYSNWASLPPNGVYTNPPEAVTINNITYTPTLTVSDGPCVDGMPICPPNNELKQLSVTISWETYNYTLTTLKANY